MAYEQLKEKYQHLETERGNNNNVQEIKRHFTENGMEGGFDDVDPKEFAKEAPSSKPSFPIFIFTAALLKDIIDTADLTGFGAIFTTILSVIFYAILFVWCLGKISGGSYKKPLIKYIWRRFAIVFLVELIPIVKIIPANTIFILLAHFRETKIVKVFNFALEKMHNPASGKK